MTLDFVTDTASGRQLHILHGQSALSAFRLEKLVRRLRARAPEVTGLEARFCYFLDMDAAPDADAARRLDELLLSGEPRHELPLGAQPVTAVPRPGTISPWSSKATDILVCLKISKRSPSIDVSWMHSLCWRWSKITRLRLFKPSTSKTIASVMRDSVTSR